MKDFLSSEWVKRAVAVFNLTYFAVIALLTYATFLYDLEFTEGQQQRFFTIYVGASVVFLALMIYTREVFVTRLISVLLLLVCFCLIVFNMYDWILIVPPFVVGLLIFFIAGTHETVKVVMGTIYLLLYVLGLVAYFVFNILFGGTTQMTELNAEMDRNTEVFSLYKNKYTEICDETRDDNVISKSGDYRIVLYDVQNSDKGSVNICVVPNGQDVKLKFFTLKAKGIRKTISNKGIRGTVPKIGWTETTDDNGNTIENVYYILSPDTESDMKITSVTNMPKKQYFEFLGIS